MIFISEGDYLMGLWDNNIADKPTDRLNWRMAKGYKDIIVKKKFCMGIVLDKENASRGNVRQGIFKA